MSSSSTFEHLSSEIHMMIFEYLNVHQLIESFFNLNRYLNNLIGDRHLLLECSLLTDQIDVTDFVFSKIQLEQLQSLTCYDYHLFQLNDFHRLTFLRSLVVYKYARNLPEETMIDLVLLIPAIKSCRIRMSSSQGRINENFISNFSRRESSLEYVEIQSKSGLSPSYLFSDVLRYLPRLKFLNVNIKFAKRVYPLTIEPIDALINLSTMILTMETGKLDYIYSLAQHTPNLKHLELHGSVYIGDPSWTNASQWFQVLSSWPNLRSIRICLCSKIRLVAEHLLVIRQTFQSIPYLVQRRLCPEYSQSRSRKLLFYTFFSKSS